MIPPKISPALRRKNIGKTVISLEDGKVLAFGSNPISAFKKAQRVMPDLQDQEFCVSRILPDLIAY